MYCNQILILVYNQLLQLLLLEPFSGVDFDRFVIISNSSRSELGDVCAPIGDGLA